MNTTGSRSANQASAHKSSSHIAGLSGIPTYLLQKGRGLLRSNSYGSNTQAPLRSSYTVSRLTCLPGARLGGKRSRRGKGGGLWREGNPARPPLDGPSVVNLGYRRNGLIAIQDCIRASLGKWSVLLTRREGCAFSAAIPDVKFEPDALTYLTYTTSYRVHSVLCIQYTPIPAEIKCSRPESLHSGCRIATPRVAIVPKMGSCGPKMGTICHQWRTSAYTLYHNPPLIPQILHKPLHS